MALALLIAALRIPGDATYARIGPGAFPALVGIGLMVAGVIFVRAASRGEVAAPSPPVSHTRMLWIVGGLALAIALLFRVGFPLPEVALGLIAVLARRLRGFAALIEDLSLRDVTARAALPHARRGGGHHRRVSTSRHPRGDRHATGDGAGADLTLPGRLEGAGVIELRGRRVRVLDRRRSGALAELTPSR